MKFRLLLSKQSYSEVPLNNFCSPDWHFCNLLIIFARLDIIM